MLDIKFIRENPEKVKKVIEDRGTKKVDVDAILKFDTELKAKSQELDSLRKQRNDLNDQIKKASESSERTQLIEKTSELKPQVQRLEKNVKRIHSQLNELLIWLPNIPLDDVPIGKSEKDNVETKIWIPGMGYVEQGTIHPNKGFDPKPHWEIGEALDLIDIEAGGKVSGSRFYYLKNDAVLMMYAIFDLLFKKLVTEERFTPMIVPVLVKERALFGTSHFPGDQDQVYKIDSFNVEEKSDFYLIGSSEPSLFAYYMDKTLDKADLPQKVVAISSCFRSEAGSWGKDVRGIKRTHQFDKLEMDMVIEGSLDKAKEAQEYLLSINEWLLQQLQLPYRVINMCTADLGYYAAAKKYDFEAWLSSQKEYIELGSNSITTDYQARRLNIRYKDNGQTKYAFTVNDTGVTHRSIIAILDHYQQADGSVVVPEALRGYVGKDVIKSHS